MNKIIEFLISLWNKFKPSPKPEPIPDPIIVEPDPMIIVVVDPEPKPTPDPIPVPKPNPTPTPEPKPDPVKPVDNFGENINWLTLNPLKNLSGNWGVILTDVENHLHPKYGTQYRSNDKPTWTHETLHGIHSYLNSGMGFAESEVSREVPSKEGSLLVGYSASNKYGFYVLNNKYILIEQPNIKISDVAKRIPNALRKSRYQLYLVSQQRDWNNDPLYIFDEFCAYLGGAECAEEVISKNIQNLGKTDYLWAVLEFSIYAVYVLMATKEKDSNYDDTLLKEFVAYSLKRAFTLYNRAKKISDLDWDNDAYINEIRTGSSCSELREFLVKTYSENWVKDLLKN